MKDDDAFEVPFQIQSLITNLKDKRERVHVRGNYRTRLDGIRRAIDKAISDYDVEMGTSHTSRFKKGQR